MSRTLRLSALIGLLAIVIAKPSAVWATQATQSASSKPRSLPTLLALPRIDASLVEPLYNDAIVEHGDIDDLLIRLKQRSDDTTRSKRVRANAWLISSHLQWRHGQLAAALQSVEQALAIDAHDGMSYQKAVLLDAAGDVKRAQEWYQTAEAQSTDSRLRENIRLRLTLLDAVDANVEGLVQLAKTRDRAFRNRAAVALAILGFNDEALNLYQLFGEGSERFRQHLRLAQWAVKAGEAARAQEEAWKAVDAATLDRDRRYASSILIEAHRLDSSLDQLLVRLDRKAHLTAEEQAVRIDLLRQTGQYQKAIDLFVSNRRGELSPEMQQDLLRMYTDAGQDEAMVAEYRRLISKEPTVTTWPEGLSRHYLEQGDRAGAQGVWDDFLRRNSDLDALLQGAESMAAFGLHDLAIAATEKAVAHNSDANTAARVRLAQFALYLDRGLNAEAESALAALDHALPAQSEYRVELADAYERIDKPQLAVKIWEALARAKGGLSVDEKMRLAWLLDSMGQRDAALDIWKELWATETQSARRRLIEDRLLMLAAELGSLGDIAVELEEKLANRTAGPNDTSLLISIYTKVGDSASAVEVITEYFAKGNKSAAAEIAALKEQAQVYLALNEFPELARVTRRLLEIDPANKVEYLQALLLNRIESGPHGGHADDQSAEIREWLTALHDVDGGAVGGEFEAGVLDLAGLRDEAVDAYRRALAEHPERGDNHLLLADLLKKGGRQAEAVAGLQYLTEVADDDDVFLVALDGLANMQTGNATTLKWAERRALERLTARDDKLYLYEMLSELAEESRDATVYVSALENALAHANSRRSHVLRELLASTAEVTAYAASQGLHRPDPARNLVYARRLIALGEDLPPDVYVNLGKTFLKMNDAGSAVRAFNLAVDRTGRPSITTEAAKLFDQAGYDREAIQEYERALVGNSGDVQAMYKLARLRDRVGLASNANELYRRGLLALFSRQTRMIERGLERNPPTLDTLVTLEFRRYYPFLLRGFISTLPAAEEERLTTLASIESAFDQELAQARSGEGTPAVLAYYPRLTVMAQAMRRVAFAVDAPDIADGVEVALVRHFAQDADLATRLAHERVSWGFAGAPLAPSVGPSRGTSDQASGSTPTAVTLQRALDREDFRAAVGISLFRNDQASALAAYRQWVRAAGLPKPPVKIGTMLAPDRSAAIPEVAAHGWARLDADHFRSLAQFIRNLVTEQDVYAEKLLASARFGTPLPGEVPILTRMERSIEQPLFSEDRLMRLIAKVQSWRDVDVPLVLARLSPANQVEVLGRYAKSSEIYWDRLFASIGVVLSKPLAQAHAAQLLATLDVAFGVVLKKTDGGYALANFMNHKFTATVHESNVAVVDAIERGIAERYPHVFKVGYFKANLLRDLGRDREALSAFVDAALQMYAADGSAVTAGQPSPYAFKSYVRTFSELIFPKYKAEVMTLLDRKESVGLTDALVGLRLELTSNDPESDQLSVLTMLQEMASRSPENELLLQKLYPMYEQSGHTARAADVLQRLMVLRPDNKAYRFHLVELWQKLNYPERALEVVGNSTIDELSRAVPGNLYADMYRGGPTGRFPVLKRAVDQIRAIDAGGDVKQASAAFRTLLQVLPPSGLSLNEFRMQMTESGDPYLTLPELLGLRWEVTAGAAPGPVATDAQSRTLGALESEQRGDVATRPRSVLDEVIKQPFAVDELESYIRTLDARDVDKQYLLYERLADAYVLHGRAAEEMRRRTAAVQSGQAGTKALTLWLLLAAQESPEKAKGLVDEVERAGLMARLESEYQRVLLARLYARAGSTGSAVDLYRAVATSVLADASGTDTSIGYGWSADPYGRDNGLTLFTARGLYEEAQQHLDRDGLELFAGDLLTLVRPRGSEFEPVYAQFALMLQQQTLDAGQPVAAVQKVAGALHVGVDWSRQDILQATDARARSGQVDEALTLLQTALKTELDLAKVSPAAARMAQATRGYRVALGVGADLPLVSAPRAASGVEAFSSLFPARADAWPGADAWVSQAAREVPNWLEQGAANRDAAVQVLSLLTLRLHQMGNVADAQDAVRHLGQLLRGGRVSVKAATLAVAVAQRVDVSLEFAVLKDLVQEGGISVGDIAAVVERTVQVEGPERAAELAELAANYTSDDDLLSRLIRIADTVGGAARAQRWIDRQSAAASARLILERKK